MDFLRCHRPHRQRLRLRGHCLGDGVAGRILDRIASRIHLRILIGDLLDRRGVLVAVEVLDHALADEHEREHSGKRQQHVQASRA